MVKASKNKNFVIILVIIGVLIMMGQQTGKKEAAIGTDIYDITAVWCTAGVQYQIPSDAKVYECYPSSGDFWCLDTTSASCEATIVVSWGQSVWDDDCFVNNPWYPNWCDLQGTASPIYGGGAPDDSCFDTDGGEDWDTFGSVIGALDGESYDDPDSCEGDTLNEGICIGDYADVSQYLCPNGCSGGECQGAPSGCQDDSDCTSTTDCIGNPLCADGLCGYDYINEGGPCMEDGQEGICESGSCIDSDYTCYDFDGIDYFTQGDAEVWLGDVMVDSFTDTCVDGDTLEEGLSFPCDDENVDTEIVDCPNGCSGGVCLGAVGCQSDDDCTSTTDCIGNPLCADGLCGYDYINEDGACTAATGTVGTCQSGVCQLAGGTDACGGKCDGILQVCNEDTGKCGIGKWIMYMLAFLGFMMVMKMMGGMGKK